METYEDGRLGTRQASGVPTAAPAASTVADPACRP